MKLTKIFTLHLIVFVLAVMLAWIAPQHEQQTLTNAATFVGITLAVVWGFAALCCGGAVKPARLN